MGAVAGPCRNCGSKSHSTSQCKNPQNTGLAADGTHTSKKKPVAPKAGNWWCDYCYAKYAKGWVSHGTEYCWDNPANAKGGKGKGRGEKGGKGAKGKGGYGKGKGGYGRGKGDKEKQNFPTGYAPARSSGHWAWFIDAPAPAPAPAPTLEQQSSSVDPNNWEWHDHAFVTLEYTYVAIDSEWTINNFWSPDFRIAAQDDHPPLALQVLAGGPGRYHWQSFNELPSEVEAQLRAKQSILKMRDENGQATTWAYFDSGASKSVCGED